MPPVLPTNLALRYPVQSGRWIFQPSHCWIMGCIDIGRPKAAQGFVRYIITLDCSVAMCTNLSARTITVKGLRPEILQLKVYFLFSSAPAADS
jgi:hypothetical protein